MRLNEIQHTAQMIAKVTKRHPKASQNNTQSEQMPVQEQTMKTQARQRQQARIQNEGL